MSKLMLVTDAWHPQINGVVRCLSLTIEEVRKLGLRVDIVSPSDYPTVPCPTYPEIRLSWAGIAEIRTRFADSRADYFHIATEGPLGLLARHILLADGIPFTTSYHTRFPEYVAARAPIPESWSYALMRRFHNSGNGCMVATKSLEEDLRDRGFKNLMPWSRGVDPVLFRPIEPARLELPRPVFLYVGRVAVEKNIETFLDLELPGSKLVVGGGPHLAALSDRYRNVTFVGPKTGDDLIAHYCAGDVFVFPSLTDTFGNVILEALACGVPVAAYPVTGPKDILVDGNVGALDRDLQSACLAAVGLSRDRCRDFALDFTWEKCSRQFVDNIMAAHRNRERSAA